MDTKNKSVKISVIIATRNEERNIENCIKSVLEQNFPKENLEIIVVDNASEDNTQKIAKRYTTSVFDLSEEVSLEMIKNYRGAQVNFGAKKATGNIIFFPDADMTFDQNLFQEVSQKMESHDALFVPEVVCGKGFFGKIRNFERSFYNETCIDGIRFIRKDLFEKIGGFDVENIVFGPDDWDLTKTAKKSGIKFAITKSVLFHHEEWLDLKTYIKKKGDYVHTFESYIKKWGKEDADIKKQFGFFYRFFGVFTENGKWIRLVKHPVITLGMYSLRFIIGIYFLIKK